MPDYASGLEHDIEKERERLFGSIVEGMELTGREDMIDVLRRGFPAFGGKHLRVVYPHD